MTLPQLISKFLKTGAFKCFGISTTAARHKSDKTPTHALLQVELKGLHRTNYTYPYYSQKTSAASLSLRHCLLWFSRMLNVHRLCKCTAQQHEAQW